MKTTTLRKALVSGTAAVSVLGLATPAVFADGGNNYGSGNRNSYSSSYGRNSNNNRHCNNNNNKNNKRYGNNNRNRYNNTSYRMSYGQRW
ncbi:MAG TPA: hypothetical protein VGM08_01785 [Candidatus Saccharimonadales bacterium]|jgi:hypothetical protein